MNMSSSCNAAGARTSPRVLALLFALVALAPAGASAQEEVDPYQEARKAFTREDFARARTLLEPLAAGKGANADVLALLGLARLQLAKPDVAGAAAVLQRALRIDADHVEANFACGLLLNRQNQPLQALRHLKKVVLGLPQWADGHLQAGLALYELGRLEDAKGEFRQATSLPAAVEYLAIIESLQGRHAVAADLMDRLISRLPPTSRGRERLLFQHGAFLRKAGRNEEALRKLAEALESGFDRMQLHQIRGDIHYDAERLDEALAAYRRALEASPVDQPLRDVAPGADLHYGIGLIHYRQKKWDAARGALARAVAEDAFHRSAWYKLGQARQRLGDCDAAREALLRHRDVERLHKQLASARRSLHNVPDNLKNRVAHAHLLMAMDRWHAAFRELRIAEQMAPDRLDVLERLLQVAEKLHRKDLVPWYTRKIEAARAAATKASGPGEDSR